MARGEPRFDVTGERLVKPVAARLAEVLLERDEIAPIGGQRVGGQAIFKPDSVNKSADGGGL